MRPLQTLGTLILVILILPWGAYSGKFAAMAQAQDATVAVAPDVLNMAPQIAAMDQAQIAPAPKRCCIAIMTGSPCGTDVVLAVSQSIPQGVTSRPKKHLIANMRLRGVVPAEDWDPPRPC